MNAEGVPSYSFGNDPAGEDYLGILATYPPGGCLLANFMCKLEKE